MSEPRQEMETQDDDIDAGVARTPIEDGKPTVYVFIDDNGEIQVGANAEVDMGEMMCMLEVAKAKLELLGYRLARKAQRQAELRQTLLQGIR